MDFDYVSVEWDTEDLPKNNPRFVREYNALIVQGWEEACRAVWYGPKLGGACIMRRPKDEPRKWTKAEIRALFQAEWIQACE